MIEKTQSVLRIDIRTGVRWFHVVPSGLKGTFNTVTWDRRPMLQHVVPTALEQLQNYCSQYKPEAQASGSAHNHSLALFDVALFSSGGTTCDSLGRKSQV